MVRNRSQKSFICRWLCRPLLISSLSTRIHEAMVFCGASASTTFSTYCLVSKFTPRTQSSNISNSYPSSRLVSRYYVYALLRLVDFLLTQPRNTLDTVQTRTGTFRRCILTSTHQQILSTRVLPATTTRSHSRRCMAISKTSILSVQITRISKDRRVYYTKRLRIKPRLDAYMV